MEEDKMRVGNVSQVGGDVLIAGRDLVKGYTPEEVSRLLEQISSTFQPKPFDGRCPYKGLAVFEEEDAELFFGRERLVENLVRRVQSSRTVFITGPSGSGKSSLVRAGLIPALRNGAIEGSERWLYQTMRPGRDPLSELARMTAGIAGTLSAGEDIRTKGLHDATILLQWCEIALKDSREKRVVLFIDQFEEIFTQLSREEERAAFLNLILCAATSENGRVIVLFAMRSDFVSNCATYPQLNELLNQQFVQIGAMQPAELVSAIAQPALRVGLRVDPELISQIISDMQGEPGALPLMQFVLRDLFNAEQVQGGVIALKLEDYLQRGGLRKALERHADAEFDKLTKTEKSVTENLFKGLVEIGENTLATRRIARYEEFASSGTALAAFDSVVTRLADARLISTDENQAAGRTITLAHEKLIEAWPWLQQLIKNNRELIRLQNQILEDAIEWEKHGKDKSYLYAGTRLASIQKVTRDFQIKNEKAKLFLNACQAAYRRMQLQRLLVAGLILLLGTITYYGVIRPSFENQLDLQPVDLGEAGVNALQLLPDGSIYAGMYNYNVTNGAPCLAQLPPGKSKWERLGPTCTTTVNSLWVNPANPSQIYFSHSDGPGLYRSLDGGRTWEKAGTKSDLPMERISGLTGSPEGSLFVGDFKSAVGVYVSRDQGDTWARLDGSPDIKVFTLMWAPQKGLLVGGNGGLWLWNGQWQQLIALDESASPQRILSAMILPGEPFSVLAGGDKGVFLWKEGDPPHSAPQNDTVEKAWSLVLVTKPEPYVIAMTFPDSKIWRMTPDGKNPTLMRSVGSDGFPLIVQNEDPLQLWVGTTEGLFSGTLRNRASQLTNGNPKK